MSCQSESVKLQPCTLCGHCCKGRGRVYINKQEAQAIADDKNMSLYDFNMNYTHPFNGRVILKNSGSDQACIFLKDNQCSIHPLRPTQCRDFPFWDDLFKDKKVYYSFKKDCDMLRSLSYEEFTHLDPIHDKDSIQQD